LGHALLVAPSIRSLDRVLLIAGVDEDVHLLANEERNVLVLDAVDDLKDMRIDSLRTIASN
jgi:hypothetical protein